MTEYILNLQLFATQTTLLNADGNDISPENKTFYEKRMLDNVQANLVHDQFADKKTIPAHGGKSIEFRRMTAFPIPETPLTEGVTPDGEKINIEDIVATIGQFGSFTEISDVMDLTTIDRMFEKTVSNHGAQAGTTLDHVTRDVMLTGTNVLYAGGVESRAELSAANTLTVDDLVQAAAILKAQNVPKIDDSYWAIVHPFTAADLMRSADWIDVKKYNDTDDIKEGEIGKLYGIRFVESSEAKVINGAAADGLSVYCTFLVGEDAYATVDVEGGNLQYILKPLGAGNDPLNQRRTAGWKAMKTAVILDDSRMVRIEHTSKKGAKAATN